MSLTEGRAAPGLAERLAGRDRFVVVAALALVALTAWWWLLSASGGTGDMAAMAMHARPAAWTAPYWTSAFLMWALMMVAMMLPAAAPMILIYARIARSEAGDALPPTALFASAYILVWTLFSAAAATIQALLVDAGLVSAMELSVGSGRVAGVVLVLASLYQLSRLKQACLAGCRSPLSFLMRLWRPGASGALRLGFVHGLYCLGCCWALMALLFVGGVMNLAWVAGLAVIVLAEKLAPPLLPASRIIAVALLLAGLYLIVAG